MHFDIVLLNENCIKCIYQLLNSNYLVPTASYRWNNELLVYEQTLSTYHSFKICFKTTTDTTVQWLQYGILHRILPVNYYLKKIQEAHGPHRSPEDLSDKAEKALFKLSLIFKIKIAWKIWEYWFTD